MATVVETIRAYSDAGYPAVCVETAEERRLIDECKTLLDGSFSIAAVGGLLDEKRNQVVDASSNFTKAFAWMQKKQEICLFVCDFQHNVGAAMSYRPLLQSLPHYKSGGNMAILISPVWKLPEELKHLIPVIRFDLPSTEELRMPLDRVLQATNSRAPENYDGLVSAARGLTMEQAENVFSLSSNEKFSQALVEREKMRLVRSDYMSVERPTDISQLAGLGQLKEYVLQEVLTSRDDEDLQVRGICLIGVPGTGKSLSARVISSLLQWPLVRFDISAAKGSLVGQSEANIRKALATADAIAPCVLWLDEIEKAVGGHSSSAATDGGTTLAMVGTLLTWMQEHKSPVIVVATCNDYSKLPPEMTRAGRFDEKFFLDLPSIGEREEIAKVHLKRLKCDENYADAISEMSDEWTGAEIEQLVKSTARRTSRNLSIEALDKARGEIIPISKTTSIKSLREWAQTNLRRANDREEVNPVARRVTNRRGNGN